MLTPRLRFNVRSLLIAIALLAGTMSLLRRFAKDDAPTIHLLGPVQVGKDGSILVQGGSVRIHQRNKQTEIRANRITVQRDGTAEVHGNATIVTTTR